MIRNEKHLRQLIAEEEYRVKLAEFKTLTAREEVIDNLRHPEKYLFAWISKQFQETKKDKTTFFTVFFEALFKTLSR